MIRARTDILIVHRGRESGRSGEWESVLADRWKHRNPGRYTGESVREVFTGKCIGSQVLFRVVNRRPDESAS